MIATRAPSATKRRAYAAPFPRANPVMSATFSESLSVMLFFRRKPKEINHGDSVSREALWILSSGCLERDGTHMARMLLFYTDSQHV